MVFCLCGGYSKSVSKGTTKREECPCCNGSGRFLDPIIVNEIELIQQKKQQNLLMRKTLNPRLKGVGEKTGSFAVMVSN